MDLWQEITDAFERAMDMPAGDRAAFLETLPQPEVRTTVLRMLAADDADGSLLDRGIDDKLLQQEAEESGLGVGDHVGPFRITGVLGRGGMGTVFEAEQDKPARRVALKMLESRALSPAARRRLGYEAELLARLEHPNIAQVYAAGTDDSSGAPRPFFAMELVTDARPLDAYVREEGLDVPSILRRLRDVAHAVHHAHQRGVVHRDLKPQNILVNGEDQLKVIDFGIGHADDSQTREAVFGTLSYMAPELLEEAGKEAGVDVRADVYALGITLFELLTGRTPFDLSGRSMTEALELLRETQIPPPSSLTPRADRELDWIVLRATARQPDARYASAAELAADLTAYLELQPLLAAPDSTTYRLHKFVRRNRVAVLAGLAVVIALVAGTAFALFGLQRAERELRTQQEVTRFLSNMLEVAYPTRDGRKVTLVEILEDAAGTLDATAIHDPEVAAKIANVLSICYRGLGLTELSLKEARRALAIAEERLAPDHPSVFSAKANIAHHLEAQGKVQEAEAMQREALAGRLARLGPDHFDVAQSRYSIGRMLYRRKEFRAAAVELKEARRILAAQLGEDSRSTIVADGLLANIDTAGDPEASVQASRAVFQRAERALGPRHPTTLDLGNSYAMSLYDAGRSDEANAMMRNIIGRYEATFGATHQETLKRLGNLAVTLHGLGRYAAAEEVLRRCLAGDSKGMKAMINRNTLGVVLQKQGKLTESRAVFEELMQQATTTLPPGHWLIGQFHKCYGDSLLAAKDYAAAETELAAGLEILARKFPDSHVRVRRAREALLAAYEANGRTEKAARLRAAIDATVKR